MKEEEVRMWFQNGNALFERNWPYAWKLHNKPGSAVKGKTAISRLPSFAGHSSASTLGGWHVGVSAFSDVKTQAMELVKFIISYRTQKQLVLNLGWNPARKDVYKDKEVIEKLPHLVKLADVFENLTARPNLPYYTIISEDIQRNLNAALAGNITADQALSKSQQKAKEIILRYGR
jgi:multiple sugar transport system substrate-binding protein